MTILGVLDVKRGRKGLLLPQDRTGLREFGLRGWLVELLKEGRAIALDRQGSDREGRGWVGFPSVVWCGALLPRQAGKG